MVSTVLLMLPTLSVIDDKKGLAYQDTCECRENPWKVCLEPDLESVEKTSAMISTLYKL